MLRKQDMKEIWIGGNIIPILCKEGRNYGENTNDVRTYVRTHKHHTSNVERMIGESRGSLSVRKTVRRIAFPQTS